MIKNYAAILSCLILFACGQKIEKKESFSISGELAGNYSDYIYLTYSTLGENSYQVKDSVKVVNGKFSFSGSVDSPVEGWINAKPSSNIAWMYLENSDIQVRASYNSQEQNGDIFRLISIDTIIGSKSYLLQEDYRKFINDHGSSPDFEQQLKRKITKIIKENPQHYFSGKLLADNVMFKDIFSHEEGHELLGIIDSTSQGSFELILIKNGLNRLERFRSGNPILDFELPDETNNLTSTESLRGKILLIDFWASWCAPCRDKHPELVDLYATHKDKGFEILSVSIDETRDPWLKAMADDQMTWKQMIDVGGFEGKTASDYFLLAIPASYLIDENGVILGANLEPKEISQFIDSKNH